MNFKNIFSINDSQVLSRKVSFSILILLLLSILINVSARLYEDRVWKDNPSIFSPEGNFLVRTGDPAYFTNIALYLKKGMSVCDYIYKLNFPSTICTTKPPLLSKIIAYLSKDSSLEEIIKAGNKIILISSAVTTIGVFLFFFIIGSPYEGIIASTATGITSTFFLRSSIGYIDTDILNLFFMYFLFAGIYMTSQRQSWSLNIFYIILTGLIAKIFMIWYSKPELLFMALFSLIFFTTIHTKDWKKIILNILIFTSITGPDFYINSLKIILNNPYLSEYLSSNIQSINLVNNTTLNFNNIFEFIGEQKKTPLIDLLKLNGSIYLGLFSFTGLILWGIRYPVMMVGFAPLSLFFLLSIILGQRALFYSLPFQWFGLSYLVNSIVLNFMYYKKIKINKNYVFLFTSLLMISFAVLHNNTFSKQIMQTYIPSSVYKAMINLSNVVEDKENSIIVSPWTYGYQSVLHNDIPVLIHPGIPTSPRHYFIARAFTSFDLNEMKKILNYIATGNVEKINQKKLDNFVTLSKDLYKSPMSDKDIYIMLTHQQQDWVKPDGLTAYWDIEKNQPYFFKGKTAFEIFNFLEIDCDDLDTKTFKTKCSVGDGRIDKDIPVNLALGLWDGKPILKRVVQIANGKVEINQEYENSRGDFVFQIVKNLENNTSRLYLMHDALFRSSYNKLFHLNESENYELVYDDYPHVKIYKVN